MKALEALALAAAGFVFIALAGTVAFAFVAVAFIDALHK